MEEIDEPNRQAISRMFHYLPSQVEGKVELTSMGLRKVTLSNIGPACIVKTLRVGVMTISFNVVAFPSARAPPSHWKVAPSTRMKPDHPSIFTSERVIVLHTVRIKEAYVVVFPEDRPRSLVFWLVLT